MTNTTAEHDHNAAFTAAYNALNTAQRQAVDLIEGPVMVIAGPGTGKTQILTLRIANILLQTDTAPESILALTFTESGAKAMRERLRRYIGARAYQVPIYTFHGFAKRLIDAYPAAYARIIGGRPASDLEKITLLESILDSRDIVLLRPAGDPSYYVTHILRMVSELKKEFVAPDALAHIIAQQETELLDVVRIHEKGAHKGKVTGAYTKKAQAIAKNRELLFVYRQYEALLRSHSWYDFEDMISETVLALSHNEEMLRDLQEQYQYILADEHQDVNGSQNRILELLASYHDAPNIFVVGDEKQAIYRFQGASLENFLFFESRFPGTTTIALTENYRSGQVILDAAHSLVAVPDGPLAALRVPLSAEAVTDSSVTKRVFSHQAIEDEWVVAAVQAAIAAGTSPEEIAIIVRTNREVESYAAQLRKVGVGVAASADGDILVHPITLAIEALVAAVLTDSDEAALFSVIHGAYWGLTVNDIVKIMRARSYSMSLLDVLCNESVLSELQLSSITAARAISVVIETARIREVTEPPHRVLEYILQASGFLNHVMVHDPIEGVRVVRRLYDEVEALVLEHGIGTLRVVRDMFAKRRAYNLPLNAPYITTDTKAVQVMTAHKSKGLEFSVVFVPHLQDSNWGGSIKRTYFDVPLAHYAVDALVDTFDDERRLLYVAMTRAKAALHFSSAEVSISSKSLIPTRLFDAIDDATLTHMESETVEAAFDPGALLQQSTSPIMIDTQLLTEALKQRGFSATSLNNYLRNPWDYLYRNVLRIPEVQPPHMQFGTAVHAVLEYVTKTYTDTGVMPTDTSVKVKLEQSLGRLPLSQIEFVRLLDKGLTTLYPYIAHMAATLPSRTKEELNIKVTLPTGLPALPELILTGKLDRIDLGDDGIAYRVVDYKTGKPKTRGVIEGKTASSDGAYKRQLVFYALLLSLYDDERYLTRTGVLSFVEATAKGEIKEETFTITDAEIEALKGEIVAAVEAIVNGAFLTDMASAATSDYAHLITALTRA